MTETEQARKSGIPAHPQHVHPFHNSVIRHLNFGDMESIYGELQKQNKLKDGRVVERFQSEKFSFVCSPRVLPHRNLRGKRLCLFPKWLWV